MCVNWEWGGGAGGGEGGGEGEWERGEFVVQHTLSYRIIGKWPQDASKSNIYCKAGYSVSKHCDRCSIIVSLWSQVMEILQHEAGEELEFTFFPSNIPPTYFFVSQKGNVLWNFPQNEMQVN